jgi:hypothetical protein
MWCRQSIRYQQQGNPIVVGIAYMRLAKRTDRAQLIPGIGLRNESAE